MSWHNLRKYIYPISLAKFIWYYGWILFFF